MSKQLATLILLLACLLPCSGQVIYEVPFPKPLKSTTDTVSLYFIGDVMMHARQLEHDHTSFLREIAPRMKETDFAIANMEFPMGGEPYTGYPSFSTPDWYAEYIALCGVDVFLLANNHVLDRGSKGLERTLKVYSSLQDELGTRYTGAYACPADEDACNPLIVERRGIRIALVNHTYGTNNGPGDTSWPKVSRMRRDEVHRSMQRARELGADYIIALPHWGVEYELHHCKNQEEWAEWLVSEGADLIIGAHPHVVQDTSHIRHSPVIYSLGNAVSNMSARNTRVELGVKVSFIRHQDNGKTEMLEPELDFMWCTLPGMLTDSYSTIYIKEWASRRSDWLNPSDYDNMVESYERVKAATGIKD